MLYSVPTSRSLSVVKLVARSVVFSLVAGCEDFVGLWDTSYAMTVPLGIAGSSHVIVTLKKEGTAMRFRGPKAGIRERNIFIIAHSIISHTYYLHVSVL